MTEAIIVVCDTYPKKNTPTADIRAKTNRSGTNPYLNIHISYLLCVVRRHTDALELGLLHLISTPQQEGTGLQYLRKNALLHLV